MHASTTQMHAAMDGPSATGPQWPASQSLVRLFVHNVEQRGHNSYSNQRKECNICTSVGVASLAMAVTFSRSGDTPVPETI